MINAHRRRFGDAGATDRGIFELDRADPFAARLDDVLGTVGDLHDTIRVEDSDIAGVEPVVDAHRRSRLVLEILPDHPRPPRLQPAAALAVAEADIVLVVDGAELDAEGHPALLAPIFDLPDLAARLPVAARPAGGHDRTPFSLDMSRS